MTDMNGSNGRSPMSDDQVERLLQGDSSVDPSLAGLLDQVRGLAVAPSRDLAASHISMLAEAARATGTPSEESARPQYRPGLVRRRLGARAAAVAFALLLLGAGVAAAATGTLPDPAQKAIANLAAQIGLDIPGADQRPADEVDTPSLQSEELAENTQQFVETVQQTVRDYTAELDEWVACVQENSAPACGAKPLLDMPHPSDFGLGPPDHAGKPDETGPPDHAGKPDETGPPDHAGKPDEPGPPDHAGKPDEPGPPDHAGKPDEPGPPDHAGKPDDKGPPDHAGKPDDKGPPDHAGKPDDKPKGPPNNDDDDDDD